MKEFITIWAIILGICVYEAIWRTKLDPKSEELLKEREKNEHKSTN